MFDSAGSPVHWFEGNSRKKQPGTGVGQIGVIGAGKAGATVVRVLHDAGASVVQPTEGRRYGDELVHPLIAGILADARRRLLCVEPVSKKDWPRGSNRAGPTKRERNRHNRRKHKRSRKSGR